MIITNPSKTKVYRVPNHTYGLQILYKYGYTGGETFSHLAVEKIRDELVGAYVPVYKVDVLESNSFIETPAATVEAKAESEAFKKMKQDFIMISVKDFEYISKFIQRPQKSTQKLKDLIAKYQKESE